MNSAPVTATDFSWICGLLQAGDSFYPTGSYAHSFGLEGLIDAGTVRDRPSLRAYLFHSVVPSLERVELPLTAHAWRAFAEPADWDAIAALSELSHALRPPRESRLANANIGRQRSELVALLHAHPLARDYLARASAGGWPHASAIAAALEGRVLGAPLAGILSAVFYTSIASLMSAAMKLLRLGQNASQSLLTETLTRAPVTVSAACEIPLEGIGWFNPWLDIAAARHESADTRMFIS